ncbi:acetoacetate decarboxylase family protein [Pseudomonas prosekii]|uniref:acetoacetate decarboxylase family protein n=1 Tax=Pseudomonas prosekii TaxID=1148509 RepID=UPI00359C49E5
MSGETSSSLNAVLNGCLKAVSIEFETTFEFLRSVLPPCFDLPETPTTIASISRWQSELCGEFDCGIISLKCRYKELEGTTMLVLIMSGDMPVTIGREMWGGGKENRYCSGLYGRS